MKLNLSDEQKQQLFHILTGALVAVMLLLLGVKSNPAPEAPAGGAVGVKDFISSGIKCSASSDACVQSNWGRDLVVYSDEASTQKFKVTGTTGAVTTAGGVTASAGGITATGGITLGNSTLVMLTAASQVIPGATSLSFRNNANTQDNFICLDAGTCTNRAGLTITAGALTMGTAASQIVPGATSFSIRDTANANDNLLVSNAGVVTARAGLTLSSGTLTLPTGAVGIAAVTDISRTLPLPLGGWQECTATLAISWTGAATKPEFVLVNSNLAVRYDTSGGVDTDEICSTFTVPQDYVAGGQMRVGVTQGAATVTNLESIACRWSIEGAAAGSAGTTALANQTAWQSVLVPPAGTPVAGDSVGVLCKQANASQDDTVNILSVSFDYTATE